MTASSSGLQRLHTHLSSEPRSSHSATLRWQEQQNFAPWTYIDASTPLRFADYVAGRDPALEAALDYRAAQELPELLLAAADLAAARRTLEAFANDPLNRYGNQERQMLSAAAQLTRAGQTDEALLVAEFAAARFPQSHDAHLSHALAAEQAGRTDAALAATRCALAIDPNSRYGRSLLERLGSGTKDSDAKK